MNYVITLDENNGTFECIETEHQSRMNSNMIMHSNIEEVHINDSLRDTHLTV